MRISQARGQASPRATHVAVVVLFWALIFGLTIATGLSPVLSGVLFDTDDYMRFVQVFDWLDGAGWYDLRAPRLDPPNGTAMHWARLPDLPLAAIVWAIEPWIGRFNAATVAAIVVPAVLLFAYLWTAGWMARPLLGRADAPLAVVVAALPIAILFQFTPGRVDHHAWQLLICAATLGLFARMLLRPNAVAPAISAAVLFAAGLWIGGEIVLWLGVFATGLVAAWTVQGEKYLRAGLIFSQALLIGTIGAIGLARPPSEWFTTACDAFSIVHIGAASAQAIFWLALGAVAQRAHGIPARMSLAGIGGALAAFSLFLLFPDCRNGPFGQIDPRLVAVWLINVSEARPLLASFEGQPGLSALFLLAPLGAAGIALARAVLAPRRARPIWLALALFAAAPLALTFWASRVIPFAFLSAILPLTWAVAELARRGTRYLGDWRGFALRFAALILLGPIVLLVAPLYAEMTMAATDRALDAALSEPAARACDRRAAMALLADPHGLGLRSQLIAAPIDYGPELLFRTRHGVLAAPYHRNTTGNLDAYDLFAADDAASAQAIIERRQIGLIMFCPSSASLPDRAAGQHGAFIAALAAGVLPEWLAQIALPADNGLILLRVEPI